jgi:hypothetical protein
MALTVLQVNAISRATGELEWRRYAYESYISIINKRIDIATNGYYRNVTLKSGRVVRKHVKSQANPGLWLPYLREAESILEALRFAQPSPIMDVSKLPLKAVQAIVAGLSNPEKMPCWGYNLPAELCQIGSIYRDIDDSPCAFCYARKGRYVFQNVVRAMFRRLETLLDPNWVPAMARLIRHTGKRCTSPYCVYTDDLAYPDGHYHFRWHDSGDIQGVWHLRNIARVCELTPDCIHWIPTQEYRLVKQYRAQYGVEPANLVIRRSSPTLDRPSHPWLALPGVVASYVNTGAIEDDADTYYCPSRHQDGKCGECRACWNRDVLQVAYHVH